MPQWQEIDRKISIALDTDYATTDSISVGGGCINEAYQVSNGDSEYFVKLNSADKESMFAAEAAGLEEIITSNSVLAPKAICWGSTNSHSYIVMESLALGGSQNSSALLGQQLAQMHKSTASEFGWKIDNTIGSTPQPNKRNSDWIRFFAKSRLGFQLDLAKRKGCNHSLIDNGLLLIDSVNSFFSSYNPAPSLLHGDLWSGNYGVTQSGQPVIFDPAVYYGDREADIAMTELFGGFGGDFYSSYNETWPLDEGYQTRKTLYNLYHILNHYNMFGGGYEKQANSMIQKLTSETA